MVRAAALVARESVKKQIADGAVSCGAGNQGARSTNNYGTLGELVAAGKLAPGAIVLDHHRSLPTRITVTAELLGDGRVAYDGKTFDAPGGFVAFVRRRRRPM